MQMITLCVCVCVFSFMHMQETESRALRTQSIYLLWLPQK